MDALSDPKAFLSNQEKYREQQLKACGVEETDINTDNVIVSGSKKTLAGAMNSLPGRSSGSATAKKGAAPGATNAVGATGGPEEREESKFRALTADALKTEKVFAKMLKKHEKELDALRKRHEKERGVVQKSQCGAIEKLVKAKGRDNDVVHDPTVKGVVIEQTKQWSEMMEKHRQEEWELMKSQLQFQGDLLKRLLVDAQAQQIKDLDAIFER
jgi:phosphatidylinositol phospholipase C beta